jgi:hypothetical protein
MIQRITRTLTSGAATLALVTVLAGPVAAQGVPTVDTQNIAQEIRQLQQMLQDFGLQTDLLDNALAQLEVVQKQLDQRMRRLRPIDFRVVLSRSVVGTQVYELTGESRTRSL